MKKILFIIGNLNSSGGTERVLTTLANKLSTYDFEISIASIKSGDQPFFKLNKKIKIYSLSKLTGKLFYKLPILIHRLRKLIKKQNFDIVITVESMGCIISIPSLFGLEKHHISWEHVDFDAFFVSRNRKIIRYLTSHFCHDIITLTDKDKTLWNKNYKIKGNIHSIPNPLPIPIQKNHQYPIKSKIVLAVGRPTYTKGYDLLIKIWKNIINESPDWKLQIIGLEDDERISLTNLCISEKLDDSIQLIPPTKNIYEYYQNASIFCLTSRSESFPMVLLEALAFGLPIVSFECGAGPVEILKDSKSELIKNGDIITFSEKLLRMIKSQEVRKEISIKSQIKAESYSLDYVIEKWLILLEKNPK